MKLTKEFLQQIIKEELLKEFGSEEYGLQTKEFEPIPGLDSDSGGDRVEMKKLQTMLYRIEDDFLPFLMNTEEREIGEAANQLYKLLKARVEG